MARAYYTYPSERPAGRPSAGSNGAAAAAGRSDSGVGPGRPAPEAAAGPLARFRRLYESRDRRLCVFEDACGHVAAVKSSRLA